MSEPTTIQVTKTNKHALKHLKNKLNKSSMDAVIQYFIDNFEKLRKQSTIKTKDANLEDQYPCATRFQHDGFYFCHNKGHGIIKRLPTLKICACCKDRLDKEAFINLQQEIQKAKIHALQLGLNSKIQTYKNDLYPTCEPLEKQGRYGYEIRSEKCPDDRIKDQWHPPDVCPLTCPFLKRMNIKKKMKEAKAIA